MDLGAKATIMMVAEELLIGTNNCHVCSAFSLVYVHTTSPSGYVYHRMRT